MRSLATAAAYERLWVEPTPSAAASALGFGL
jgi:hypothetical protein